MLKKILFICGVVAVCIVLALALPSAVYSIRAAEEANSYATLDASKSIDLAYADDSSDEAYSAAMDQVVMPFIDAHKSEGYLSAVDGLQLHYAYYSQPESTGNVTIGHGFTENSAKYSELVYYFMQAGYDVFVLDHRGHGYSDRLVDEPSKVHVNAFQDYVNDYALFVERVIRPVIGDEPLYLYAHSMGGGIGAALLEQYPNMFDCAVLSCPMLDPTVSVLPRPLAFLFAHGGCFLGMEESYLPATYEEFPSEPVFEDVSCGSPVRYNYYYYRIAQPDHHYQTYNGTFGWLRAMLQGTREIMEDANLERITTPTLVFEAEGDERVKSGAIHHFINNVENSRLVYVPYVEGVRHELYNGTNETMIPYISTVVEFFNASGK